MLFFKSYNFNTQNPSFLAFKPFLRGFGPAWLLCAFMFTGCASFSSSPQNMAASAERLQSLPVCDSLPDSSIEMSLISDKQVAILQTITERVPFEEHIYTAAKLGFKAFIFNYDICPINPFDNRPSFTVYMSQHAHLVVISFKGSQPTYADTIADFDNKNQVDIPSSGAPYLPPGPAGFRGKILQSDAVQQLKMLLAQNRPSSCRPKIILAGHSLGGALAALMASYLDGIYWQKKEGVWRPEFSNHYVDRVVTFGAPPYVKKGISSESGSLSKEGVEPEVLSYYDNRIINYVSDWDFIPLSYNIGGQGSGVFAESAFKKVKIAPATYRHLGSIKHIGVKANMMPPCPHDMLSYIAELGLSPVEINDNNYISFFELCDFSKPYWQQWLSKASFDSAGSL